MFYTKEKHSKSLEMLVYHVGKVSLGGLQLCPGTRRQLVEYEGF